MNFDVQIAGGGKDVHRRCALVHLVLGFGHGLADC